MEERPDRTVAKEIKKKTFPALFGMKGDFDTSANEKKKMKVLYVSAFCTIFSHLKLLCGGLTHLLIPSSLSKQC